jgi:hypothetical protein
MVLQASGVECESSCRSPLGKFVRTAGVLCGSVLRQGGMKRLAQVRRHTVPVGSVERSRGEVVTIGR